MMEVMMMMNSYFINNYKLIFVYYCCVNEFNFDFFKIQHYLIKRYPYLICYFKFGLRTNQHLYPNLGQGRPSGFNGRTLISQAQLRR